MPIPVRFRKSGEGSIASYNYYDLQEGSGVTVFYGGTHKETTTEAFYLSTNADYANSVTTYADTTSGSAVKVLDHDYDLAFNMPKRIKGKLRAIFSIGNTTSVSGKAHETYAIVKVRKWDGTTETEIANAQSETHVRSAAQYIADSRTINVEVNISTLQKFNKGETLRITIEIWAKSSDGADGNRSGYGHDPRDRNDPGVEGSTGTKIIEDTDTTVLTFHVPFVIML